MNSWPVSVHIRRLEWITVGAVLIAIHCVLLYLSTYFDYDAPLSSYPVVFFVALEVFAGAVYFTLLWLIPRSRTDRRLLALVLGVGLSIRVLAMLSTPVLEDDFYRYLWDGAVVAGGHDPYRHSPADVIVAASGAQSTAELSALSELADRARPVVERINHPRLTTVYPPLTQGIFAFAAGLDSFGLTAWRLTLLLFEAATLVLLYLLLRHLKRSSLWLAIYWWNPLVVKELVNSAHMDALLLPALCGVLLLTLLQRRVLACTCLALAAGIKLWPVLLLPVVLRGLVAQPAKLAAALGVFLVGFAATAWWLYRQVSSDSGLVAYASSWNMNDALFLALDWMVENALTALGHEWIASGSVTRAMVAATIVWLAVWLNRHVARDADALCHRLLVLIAVIFLLSPTQFPWYYTWLVPFLVLTPSPALLLLTVLLPLYYLRFHFDARGQSRLFDYWIVWLEYLPVWLLLAREWLLSVRQRPPPRLALGEP